MRTAAARRAAGGLVVLMLAALAVTASPVGAAADLGPPAASGRVEDQRPGSVATISDDGRFAAVVRDWFPFENPPSRDVFVRDLWCASTQPVPTRLSAAGSVAPQVFAGGFLQGVSATPDGRYVVFSAALDIPRYEVAVWDRWRGTVRKVSVGPDGDPDFGHAADPSISADGRFVAYVVAGYSAWRVLVTDLWTGTVRPATVGLHGAAPDGVFGQPALSADGRFVAFTSAATNLVPGDTNGVADVFVRDLRRGLTRRVNLGRQGAQADGGSSGVSLSADGHLLAFDSVATNLLRSGPTAHGNVFVRDLRTGALRRVSRTPSGAEPDGNSSTPVLSANGRFLGYDSTASDLVPDDTNHLRDGFVVDLRHATTQRVTLYPPENRG